MNVLFIYIGYLYSIHTKPVTIVIYHV